MDEIQVLDAEVESRPPFDFALAGEQAAELASIDARMEKRAVTYRAKYWYAQAGDLQKAHDLLANNRNGCFGAWAAYRGLSREMTSRILRRYNFVNQVDSNRRAELLALPVSLIDEAAKPSTPEEVVTAVLDGQIKTAKQAREMKEAVIARQDQTQEAETVTLDVEAETVPDAQPKSRMQEDDDLAPDTFKLYGWISEGSKRAFHTLAWRMENPLTVEEFRKPVEHPRDDTMDAHTIRRTMERFLHPVRTAREIANDWHYSNDDERERAINDEWSAILLDVSGYWLAATERNNEEQRQVAKDFRSIYEANTDENGDPLNGYDIMELLEYLDLAEMYETLYEYLDNGAFDSLPEDFRENRREYSKQWERCRQQAAEQSSDAAQELA